MTRPDLHIHSTFSDGAFTPMELVEKAVLAGVTAMAITDHDCFDGCDSLAGQALPIPLLPGVELSLRDRSNLHLLGYGFGQALPLRDKVRALAEKRAHRARAMMDMLVRLGMPLDWQDVTNGSTGTVGRMHIALAMVRRGYVATTQEAFERYLAEGRPAYVPGERLSMEEALPLLRSCGFVPVLAHPSTLRLDDLALRTLLTHWQGMGLMGVEVYHPSRAGRTASLDRMARSMGLLVTGGSDYHREGDHHHGSLGSTCGAWITAEQDLQALMAAMQNHEPTM